MKRITFLLLTCLLFTSFTVIVSAADTVSVSISASPIEYESNSWIHLNVTVTNNGSTTVENLMVQRSMSLVDRQNIGTLAPGATQTINFTYQVGNQNDKVTFNVVNEQGTTLGSGSIDLYPKAVTTSQNSTDFGGNPANNSNSNANDQWYNNNNQGSNSTSSQGDSNSSWDSNQWGNVNNTQWNNEWIDMSPTDPNNGSSSTDNQGNNSSGNWWETNQNTDNQWDSSSNGNTNNGYSGTSSVSQSENGTLNSGSGDIILYKPSETTTNGIPIYGSEFVLPGELPDYPLQTITAFPAMPGRGDYILLNSIYANDALASDSEANALKNLGLNGSGYGNGLYGDGSNGLGGNSGVNLNNLSIKAPQTGQKINSTLIIVLSGALCIIAIITFYVKSEKHKAVISLIQD